MRNDRAEGFSGILIAPSKRPRLQELLEEEIKDSARMAHLSFCFFPLQLGPQY